MKTPRTDAEATDGWSGDAVCVSYEFAAQLERKLIAAEEEIKKLQQKLRPKSNDSTNIIREKARYKDGGTSCYSVISGPLKGKDVYKDGRIKSETRGCFFDRYPGDSGAIRLEGYNFKESS